MKFSLLQIFIFTLFISCSSGQKIKQENASTPKLSNGEQRIKVICELDGDQRVLEVKKEGTGCTLFYTKHSKRKKIANAQVGEQYCKLVKRKVQKNLENVGFHCK